MLVGLGFGMIAIFMYLILSKRLTPVIALILVPAVFAVAAVQLGAAVVPDGGVAGAIMEEIQSFAPTAALLFFAIIYFGLMIDVGLFDPFVERGSRGGAPSCRCCRGRTGRQGPSPSTRFRTR